MSKTKTQTATPAKSLNLNEKYGIDKEMAHLLEFCNGNNNINFKPNINFKKGK